MTYQAIYFDWGGVIANDPGDEFLNELLVQIGADEQQRREIFATYMHQFMRGDISEAEYWQILRERYGLTIHDTISNEFKRWKGLVANSDILDLAIEARTRGLKAASCPTSSSQPTTSSKQPDIMICLTM